MAPKPPAYFRKTVGCSPAAFGARQNLPISIAKASAKTSGTGTVPRITIPGVGILCLQGDRALVPFSSPSTSCSSIAFDGADDNLTLGRSEAPALKKIRKASMEQALSVCNTNETKQVALDELEFDKVANSARAARASTWSTWCRMHRAWFGERAPVLPLSVQKIKAVASMFKAGHYTSFANYASRAKAEHIEQFHVHGVVWSEELAVELKNSLRSIVRGKGPSKQSHPVDLGKVLSYEIIHDAIVEGGPVGMTDLLTLGTYFMARELEIACARCSHIHLDFLAAEITWNMPVSKNDVQAVGTHRTWGCLCSASTTMGCPFHSALRQFERVRSIALELDLSVASLPFFPDSSGNVVPKSVMVASITEAMNLCGLPLKDALGRPMYGGHSMRTGGAVLLSAMGLDTARIEAMARWNSPMLLYYIRSAPLKSITNEFKLLAASRSSPPASSSRSDLIGDKKLLKVLNILTERLDKSDGFKESCDNRLAALEASAAPIRFIMNCASNIWHISRDHIAGKSCYTACGWQYTGLHFEATTEMPTDISHKAICGSCMPAERLLASMD